MKLVWIAIIIIAVALLAYLGLRLFIASISKRPGDLGVTDGQLRVCPDMPNCVCSQSSDERHRIAPLQFAESVESARSRLLAILQAMPRSTIVTAEADYVHAEVRTPGFGYVDDLEFYIDESAGRVHVRSGARVPYYDFEVNRKRIESIRAKWEQAQ